MAVKDARNLFARLLPKPRKALAAEGICCVGPQVVVDVRVDDSRVERAVRRWLDGIVSVPPFSSRSEAAIRVVVDDAVAQRPGGYRLTIQPGRIELIGASAAACFHGLQTLSQLTSQAAGQVACGVVEDWPTFATRGLLHDVTRGKVPTLATLKMLVDRLSLLKINQLQLYIEHAFVFSFDPSICRADDGLTPDEVRELDRYCQERFIDLVPAIASPGHMGRILSMPKYRHLAEIESAQPWERMNWPQRARGLTLDVSQPESRTLIRNVWNDVLAAFTSPVVNICGDEPWDLGKGKNRGRFDAKGTGKAYVDYLRFVCDVCASDGRRCQVWSDVIRNHTDLLSHLPGDLTVLHWGYDDDADYEATRRFVDAGFDTFVCPGTSGWKRIINAMGLAERNISTFADAGSRYGAVGLLNTDWGDHGHFNQLACSWHGIALGAACGWDAQHPIGSAFDERFASTVWGLEDASVVDQLRRVSRVADSCETWRLMGTPLGEMLEDATLPTIEAAEELAGDARDCGALLGSMSPCDGPIGMSPCDGAIAQDFSELAVACLFSELFAERVLLAHSAGTQSAASVSQSRAAAHATPPQSAAHALQPRAAGFSPRGHTVSADAPSAPAAMDAYAQCWNERNKPSGLSDILTALQESVGLARSHDPEVR